MPAVRLDARRAPGTHQAPPTREWRGRAPIVVALAIAALGPIDHAAALCTATQLSAADPGCPATTAPCSITKRHVIEDGCVLELGGRDVIVANNGTLDIGNGAVSIRARNFTVANGGLVDSRPLAGLFRVFASGDIRVERSLLKGILLQGSPIGGIVEFDAGGGVVIDGRIKATNGGSNTAAADGGTITINATGDIVLTENSDVDVSGGALGVGGNIDFTTRGGIDIRNRISATGGQEGGTINIRADGAVTVGARLSTSATDGGCGNEIDISSGGTLTVTGALDNNGSGVANGGGQGGLTSLTSARGSVLLRSDVTAKGGDLDGSGGEVVVSGRSVQIQSGRIDVQGATFFTCGGFITLEADDDITTNGLLVTTGSDYGGEIDITAGRTVTVNATIDVRSRAPGSFAGLVLIDTGQRIGGGDTVVNAKIDASGPRCIDGFCSLGGNIDLVGCDVTINTIIASPDAPTLDAQAPGSSGSGGTITISARRKLTVRGPINAGAFFQGMVDIVHPSLTAPTITRTPNPTPSVRACDERACASTAKEDEECDLVCVPVCDCGDGLPNQFEECDSGAAGCDVVGGEVCGVPTSRRGCFCIATCGNGQINVGEDCETGLPGADCRSRGYAGGEGACVDCAFDEAACNSGRCGDGIIASKAGEACEATDLAGETCESLGFTRGTLRCAPDCLRYDVSGCVRGFCGDGTLDPGEQCDAGVANRNVANAPCREDCRLPRCGDGIVDDQRAEECDDGNRSDADPCLNSCEVATCGDGILCTARACVTGPNRGPEQCEFNSACCESACAVRTCDDGLLCGDRGNNVCCHPDRACDDGNPCTKDLCEDFVGCQHTPIANCCAADRDCDDGNVCTDDTCDEPAVTCVFTPNTSACNDGSVCTSDDGCSGGVCGGTPVGCVSPEVCLAPIGCHPGDGCQFGRIAGCCEVDGDCNDGDACTSDTCDPATNRCRTSQVACESADACFVVSGCDQALGCLLARRRGFAALDCLIGLEIARLDEAVRGNLTALGPKLTNQLAKFSTKGRKKLDKAIDLAGKAPKALKQVRGGRTLFGKFSKVLAQQADKGKVNRALADDLLSRVNVIDAEIGIVAADLGG